jgi:TolA-binding protein
VVVAIEHIVIFILIAIKTLIPDVPKAVKKSNERTKNEIKTLHMIDLSDSTRVKELEDELESLQKKMKNMENKKPSNDNKALEIIRYH